MIVVGIAKRSDRWVGTGGPKIQRTRETNDFPLRANVLVETALGDLETADGALRDRSHVGVLRSDSRGCHDGEVFGGSLKARQFIWSQVVR